MKTTVPAGREAMAAPLLSNPSKSFVPFVPGMADRISLTTAILRYRGAVYTHMADQSLAEDLGRDTNLPRTFIPAMEALEQWARPAASLAEAIDALELAIEDYEKGYTPRIPAMMKAAAGWMRSETKRRQEACESAPASTLPV